MDCTIAHYFIAANDVMLAPLLADWQKNNPASGILALVAERSAEEVAPLQAHCRNTGMPLVGAIFPELIYQGRFHPQGLLLIPLEVMPPYLLLADAGPGNESFNEELCNALDKLLNGVSSQSDLTLFMLFDGMLPNIGTLLEKIYLNLADQVQYVGANAGSENFQPMACLFDQNRLLGDGLLALLFPSALNAMLDHSYSAADQFIMATATEGNKITSIDWRPAFEVYAQIIKEQYAVDITRENFYQYGVHFPFGILRINGDYLLRIPVALTDEDALYCVGEIPTNALLTLMQAIPEGSASTVDKLSSQAVAAGSGILLGFYCAGRRLHLGEYAHQELSRWHAKAQPRMLVGALSLGEIGSDLQGGYPFFQNACLVAIPWK